jgi:serine/threonine-protein phosphatase 2B catalytic subunit
MLDLFAWSIPFLAEKVIQILNYCLTHRDDDDPTLIPIVLPDEPSQRAEILRFKILAVAKMKKMLTTLRTERELILLLKGMVPDGKIPRGILLDG